MKYIALGLVVIALSIGAVLVYERVSPTFDVLNEIGTTTPESEQIDLKGLKDRDFKVGVLEDVRFTSLVMWPEYEAAAPIVGKSDIFDPAQVDTAPVPAQSMTTEAPADAPETAADDIEIEPTDMPLSDPASSTPMNDGNNNGL